MYLVSKLPTVVEPALRPVVAGALDELESVHAFIYSRVGNRADAEDLTQQVALKALPRLRDGSPAPAVRGYLYATARSVLANFWTGRSRLHESELPDNLWIGAERDELLPSPETVVWVKRILEGLSPSQRSVLELRFLSGYSLREVADEMAKSVGSIKVMQLRALRRAAVTAGRLEVQAEVRPGPEAGSSRPFRQGGVRDRSRSLLPDMAAGAR
jgi:RNA polymerase sigma factor (sigma-70 family)